MTTVLDQNVHNIAVTGAFDDCQTIVKDSFNDLAFRDTHSLGAINSINWARILAQVWDLGFVLRVCVCENKSKRRVFLIYYLYADCLLFLRLLPLERECSFGEEGICVFIALHIIRTRSPFGLISPTFFFFT